MRKCTCHSHNGLLLSPEGLAQREAGWPAVDAMEEIRYLDSIGSVSGLELERDLFELPSDLDIDEQARRFHHGS